MKQDELVRRLQREQAIDRARIVALEEAVARLQALLEKEPPP